MELKLLNFSVPLSFIIYKYNLEFELYHVLVKFIIESNIFEMELSITKLT